MYRSRLAICKNALKAVESFLDSLRMRDEKMVLANFLIYIRGKTPEEVDAVMKSVQDRVAAAGCSAPPVSGSTMRMV